jgi:hypothetical protein
MKCIICNGGMAYSFSKDFGVYGLSGVDYLQCPNCGFTMSGTHADMEPGVWASLNHDYHSAHHGGDYNADDPRWVQRLRSQAMVLADACRIGLLNGGGRWLDYACGDGKLSDMLRGEGRTLLKYDKYMPRHDDYLDDDEIAPSAFDFVLTTSVFEHFTLREQFDAVEALTSKDGVLGLHTLVCEKVPCDPSWFYLLPVHCAFHTNRSMSLLFEQWGYASSVYNVDSRLWLWYKPSASGIQDIVESANRRPGGPSYIFKNGFVDYWK